MNASDRLKAQMAAEEYLVGAFDPVSEELTAHEWYCALCLANAEVTRLKVQCNQMANELAELKAI